MARFITGDLSSGSYLVFVSVRPFFAILLGIGLRASRRDGCLPLLLRFDEVLVEANAGMRADSRIRAMRYDTLDFCHRFGGGQAPVLKYLR